MAAFGPHGCRPALAAGFSGVVRRAAGGRIRLVIVVILFAAVGAALRRMPQRADAADSIAFDRNEVNLRPGAQDLIFWHTGRLHDISTGLTGSPTLNLHYLHA
ncbi:hypothetical protein [Pseudoduganella flava]|uniref:Uncharacterized protein n=1 Tax=Pseudoduganella flava TaxID=871742 RepID=A0ABX6G043_9BURK|nr:hypothetical protein [Pseudoduganella flava]QGZ42376.1 hypothetical protein GO485_27325 [Pseudoduganella flava]